MIQLTWSLLKELLPTTAHHEAETLIGNELIEQTIELYNEMQAVLALLSQFTLYNPQYQGHTNEMLERSGLQSLEQQKLMDDFLEAFQAEYQCVVHLTTGNTANENGKPTQKVHLNSKPEKTISMRTSLNVVGDIVKQPIRKPLSDCVAAIRKQLCAEISMLEAQLCSLQTVLLTNCHVSGSVSGDTDRPSEVVEPVIVGVAGDAPQTATPAESNELTDTVDVPAVVAANWCDLVKPTRHGNNTLDAIFRVSLSSTSLVSTSSLSSTSIRASPQELSNRQAPRKSCFNDTKSLEEKPLAQRRKKSRRDKSEYSPLNSSSDTSTSMLPPLLQSSSAGVTSDDQRGLSTRVRTWQETRTSNTSRHVTSDQFNSAQRFRQMVLQARRKQESVQNLPPQSR